MGGGDLWEDNYLHILLDDHPLPYEVNIIKGGQEHVTLQPFCLHISQR